MYKSLICMILLLVMGSFAHADSARMSHRFGLFAGIDDPMPSAYGFNLGYITNDAAQLQIGAGTGTVGGATIKTVAAGFKVFVPNWNLSPTLGLGLSYFDIAHGSIAGYSGSHVSLYYQVGVDWHTPSGFYVGLGFLYFDLGFYF